MDSRAPLGGRVEELGSIVRKPMFQPSSIDVLGDDSREGDFIGVWLARAYTRLYALLWGRQLEISGRISRETSPELPCWLVGYVCYKSHIREEKQVSISSDEVRKKGAVTGAMTTSCRVRLARRHLQLSSIETGGGWIEWRNPSQVAERTKTLVATRDARARKANEVDTARAGCDRDWRGLISVLSCVAEASRIPGPWTGKGVWLQPRYVDTFCVNSTGQGLKDRESTLAKVIERPVSGE